MGIFDWPNGVFIFIFIFIIFFKFKVIGFYIL
jgi:hypothetical protein